MPQKVPAWLQTATVAFPSGRTAEELVADDAAHLVWAVNLGVIDFNPWPARRADLDHPDELRVDLDPTPGVDVGRRAPRPRWSRATCSPSTGCAAIPKTSGSKGIHVNVRIEPRWDFLEVRRAALALAREVERRAPELATSKWWKEERHGVFVDYNQNARDRTVASGYSVRPTPDARVSCALRLGRGARRRARRPAARHAARRACARSVIPAADIDDVARASLDAAARPRAPRRGGRARRRAVAAALPEAEGRAQAGAAQPRPRPPDAARPRRRSAAGRAAAGLRDRRPPARLRLQAADRPGPRARVRRLTILSIDSVWNRLARGVYRRRGNDDGDGIGSMTCAAT